MNIVIVSPEYPPRTVGGGGIVYKNIAKELKRRGHKVKVLAGNFQNKGVFGRVEHTCEDEVNIYFLPLLSSLRVKNLDMTIYTPPTLHALMFLIRELLFGRHDVIHLHGVCHPLIDIAAFACVLKGKEYVFTCHGIPRSPETAGFLFRVFFTTYLTTVARFVLRKARVLTTVSYFLLKECYKKKLTNRRMTVIPNGPNEDLGNVSSLMVQKIERKYSLENRKLIFSIGRLTRVKGYQYLIEAMPYVASKFPDALAIIAGRGSYGKVLKESVDAERISNHARLIGWIDEEEKKALYQRADVVVFPSLHEPFGMVLLEALAMHKPVIAFNAQPMSDIISDKIDGLLVPSGDKRKLADAIVQILSESKLREKLVSNTYDKINIFKWDQITDKYLHTYYLACQKAEQGDLKA